MSCKAATRAPPCAARHPRSARLPQSMPLRTSWGITRDVVPVWTTNSHDVSVSPNESSAGATCSSEGSTWGQHRKLKGICMKQCSNTWATSAHRETCDLYVGIKLQTCSSPLAITLITIGIISKLCLQHFNYCNPMERQARTMQQWMQKGEPSSPLHRRS